VVPGATVMRSLFCPRLSLQTAASAGYARAATRRDARRR
jgi:hypothetical protein